MLLRLQLPYCVESPSVFYLGITLSHNKPSTSPNARGFIVNQHDVDSSSGGTRVCFLFHISGARFIFQRFASTWLSGCRLPQILFEGKVRLRSGENEKKSESGAPSVKVSKQ